MARRISSPRKWQSELSSLALHWEILHILLAAVPTHSYVQAGGEISLDSKLAYNIKGLQSLSRDLNQGTLW